MYQLVLFTCYRKDIKIFGIDVVVPDVYPILKYPEVVKAQRSHHRDQHSIGESSEASHEVSHDSSRESHDPGGPGVEGTEACLNRVVNIDQIDNGGTCIYVYSQHMLHFTFPRLSRRVFETSKTTNWSQPLPPLLPYNREQWGAWS